MRQDYDNLYRNVTAESSRFQVSTNALVHKQVFTRIHANADTRIMKTIMREFQMDYIYLQDLSRQLCFKHLY